MSSSIWTYAVFAVAADGTEIELADNDENDALEEEWRHEVMVDLAALPAGTVKLRVVCD